MFSNILNRLKYGYFIENNCLNALVIKILFVYLYKQKGKEIELIA